jgi:hypothetical protein
MFHLDTFVIQGHQKIFDHYRRLRDTAKSEEERERFQRRMTQEYEAVQRFIAQQPGKATRAA